MNRKQSVIILCATLTIVGCWAFPVMWYERPSQESVTWLSLKTQAPGWTIEFLEVGESAERVLAADELKYAECRTSDSGQLVRVFTAKRFNENPHEIGLFVHTPDRCWTESGWMLTDFHQDIRRLEVHGNEFEVERRIFTFHDKKELVYFFGLVGGKPLPYRLDHNLSVGRDYRIDETKTRSGGILRAKDKLLWSRVWDSFASRKQLFGPKEFIRISTEISSGEEDADALLERSLAELITQD